MAAGLEGTWEMVRAERDGAIAPELVTLHVELELTGDRYAVRCAGQVADRGRYTLAANVLTLFGTEGPNEGRTIPCIFQRVGHRLRICYGLDGQTPTAFTAGAGSPQYLATYRLKNIPEKGHE